MSSVNRVYQIYADHNCRLRGWLETMLTELLIFVSLSAEGADNEGSELNEQLHSSS